MLKKNRMKRVFLGGLACWCWLGFGLRAAEPAPHAPAAPARPIPASVAPQADQIVFLHLRRDAAGVTLLKTATRPGRLKPQPPGLNTGPLEYELASASDAVLATGRLLDPLLQRLEYEDPAQPGQLRQKIVERPEAQFTLRVPHHAAARLIRFYLRQPATPGLSAQSTREMIAEISLPLSSEPAEAAP